MSRACFWASVELRHPEVWGRESTEELDTQAKIAFSLAGIHDVGAIAVALKCSPDRVERMLSAWEYLLRRSDDQPAEPDDSNEVSTPQPSPPPSPSPPTTPPPSIDISDPADPEPVLQEISAPPPTPTPSPSPTTDVEPAEPEPVLQEISPPSTTAAPTPSPTPSPAPPPTPTATPPSPNMPVRLHRLHEIAAASGDSARLATDYELTLFMAFAETAFDEDDGFIHTQGAMSRRKLEQNAEAKWLDMSIGFKSLQSAGLIILDAAAFAPSSPYFRYSITPEGARVLLDALEGDDD